MLRLNSSKHVNKHVIGLASAEAALVETRRDGRVCKEPVTSRRVICTCLPEHPLYSVAPSLLPLSLPSSFCDQITHFPERPCQATAAAHHRRPLARVPHVRRPRTPEARRLVVIRPPDSPVPFPSALLLSDRSLPHASSTVKTTPKPEMTLCPAPRTLVVPFPGPAPHRYRKH